MSVENALICINCIVCKRQESADLGRSSVTRVLPCFGVGNDGAVFGN